MKFTSLENISLQGLNLEWDPKVGDPKVRAMQTGFINENKLVKYNICKLYNPKFK